MLKKWLSDASLSTVVAGFVAVLVGFTSSAAIVFAAAQALGANEAQTVSWMWALGLGMGGTSLVLSLWYRQPVLTAWSTPGAAVLAVTQGVTLPEATGAFIVSALLIKRACNRRQSAFEAEKRKQCGLSPQRSSSPQDMLHVTS